MQKLLIVGCGDIARRTLPLLLGHYRIYALLRDPAQLAVWRTDGVRPLLGDLDHAAKLKRIWGLADIVLHFAPPSENGAADLRTRRLLAALCRGKSLPQRMIYISTSGVYGDCAGERVNETRQPRPSTPRAVRRADAERQLRRFGMRRGVCVSILRVPGIYAGDRLPVERLQKGAYALSAEDDVYTNHIHADDLARLACAALRYGRPNRCYNASDDSEMKMGDYFDLVADSLGLPRALRVPRREMLHRVTPLQLSFMNESRRLDNRRVKYELKAQLRYPKVADGVDAARRDRVA